MQKSEMEKKEAIHHQRNGSAAADEYVTVTFDVEGDAVALRSVEAAEVEPEPKAVDGELVKKPSFGASVVRSASSKIKKRLASLKPGRRRLDRSKSAAAQALTGLKFISKSGGGASWSGVEDRFEKLSSSTPGLLQRSDFGECIGMKESKPFACELFDALARRRNISGGTITKEQLKDFWLQISDQSFDCRLQTFFDMVDKNSDGRITEDEIKEIIIASASANKLTIIQEQADEYARLIMEELDPNNLGYIKIEDLEALLLQGAEEAGGDDSHNLHKLLSEKLKPAVEHALLRCYATTRYFFADNWRRLWVMAVWIGAMAALFAYKYVQYRNKTAAFEVMGHCLCMAKGAAETLKLNMALILLPMCRNTITWLRNRTRLGAAVPFDDNINFHMIVATAIGIGVGIHGISHLACDFPRLLHAGPEKYSKIAKYFGDEQPASYWHYVKGYEGVTGIIMVVLMGIAFTLASPMLRNNRVKIPKPLDKVAGFNAFWYTHHLFIIVYALLLIHGIKLYLTHEWYNKTTWMYVAVPIMIYAGERLIRAFRSSVKDVKVLKVAIYPGDANVLALQMSKPDQRFKYKSGQYIFVNCAAVSPFEWHPFSITSAPREDYLSVHIRALGDWTKQIKLVFSKACEQPPSEENGLDLKADFMDVQNNPNIPKILIDGPYGAPTQDYKNYEVVMLVGLGIGATPMISVVKDIVHNMKSIEDEENGIEAGGACPTLPSPLPKRKSDSGSTKHEFKTRRAYFYWATKEQGTFDWFKGAMNEVAEMDHKGVIEMHNYCTSVYEEGDVRSALISMLQSINHAKNGVDIVAGTRVKSHFARPNWMTVYKRIHLNHPNSRVGVFYCGAPKPMVELRRLAHDFSHKTSTKFDFHKENF